MALKDDLRDFFDRPESRWIWVAVGVVILLRLKLVLFAAALPVMAYWHFSNQDAAEPEEADAAKGRPVGKAAAPHRQRGWEEEVDDEEDDDFDVTREPKDGGAQAADVPWPDDEDDDDALFRDDFGKGDGGGGGRGGDPYDSSFWGDSSKGGGAAAAPKRNAAPPRGGGGFDEADRDPLDLDGGLGRPAPAGGAKPTKAPLWGDDDEPDDFFGLGGPGGAKKGPGDGLGEFDFLGGNDDLDILGPRMDDDMDFGFGGKGKGKGKGKKGDKGKEPGAPREADPKQVFVANIGDMPEEELRTLFEEAGDVERVKVLRTPEGLSKGVGFVTFGSVEQAQKALTMSGTPIDGRSLVVRLAHGGNKGERGEKGDKGGGKGDRFDRNDRFDRGDRNDRFDRPDRNDRFDRGDRNDRFDRGDRFDGPPDLGGSERFGGAFGDRDRAPKGKGSKGSGRGKSDRHFLDDELEEAIGDAGGPLRVSDFDFPARTFLGELRRKDQADGTQRFQEAIDMVLKYTCSKERDSVRKWPAYVFTLLSKFDPHLWEEIRDRKPAKGSGKSKGGFSGGFGGFDRPPRDD